MALRFLVPPSLGAAKATARGELLAETLERELGVPVTSSVTITYAELERLAIAGDADLIWCPAAVCAQLPLARAVYTVVRGGRSTYRSAFFARRADRLTTSTITGKRAVWVDPLSAGGYLLVMALLESRGIRQVDAFASQRFLGSHRAVVEAVLHDDADVGAVSIHDPGDDGLAQSFRWYVGNKGDELEALAVSESCPNDALVVTTRVDPAMAEQIAAALQPTSASSGRVLAALEGDSVELGDLSAYRRAFGARPTTRPPAR